MKCAVVVLTRGYTTIDGYNSLIARNLHLQRANLQGNIDYIIVHEGNISVQHQQYIQKRLEQPKAAKEVMETSFQKHTNMRLLFKEIAFKSPQTTNCPLCPQTPLSNHFNNGYKNMCLFWSRDFLEFFKEYEYILRVDEDCNILKISANIFETYAARGIVYGSPYFQGADHRDVTRGLYSFFGGAAAVAPKGLVHPQILRRETKNPYTNICIINVRYFRENAAILRVLNHPILETCIFQNRWGDLPIWGCVLKLFVPRNLFIVDRTIQYYHGSHRIRVN